ncbi:MAG: alpha/beta hydrolase [Oscillospiraceae bacterium]|nr:alpha/beta hydrolase [Oscillospiraceae bacterium]
MDNKKLIKKALRLQSLMKLYTKFKPTKVGKERIIDTSSGKVRVLEYGFDSPEIKPLFVDMHGGGFVLGSADMDEPMCLYFREQTGAKIISIDYPKAPKNPYPIAINAIYDVIKHYIHNAEKYKINSNSIGIGGHSAGGNLAAVICIMAKEKGDFSFKYAVLDYPPCDMSIKSSDKKYPKGAVPEKMVEMFDACYFNSNTETAKSPYLSPVYATNERLRGLPPTLLITAGQDSLHDEGIRYGELLKTAGVSVEFHDFSESAHGFTYNKTPDSKKGQDIMAEFIKKNM